MKIGAALAVVSFLTCTVLLAQPVAARPIRVDFSGTFDQVSNAGVAGGSVVVGTPFQGTLVFDDPNPVGSIIDDTFIPQFIFRNASSARLTFGEFTLQQNPGSAALRVLRGAEPLSSLQFSFDVNSITGPLLKPLTFASAVTRLRDPFGNEGFSTNLNNQDLDRLRDPTLEARQFVSFSSRTGPTSFDEFFASGSISRLSIMALPPAANEPPVVRFLANGKPVGGTPTFPSVPSGPQFRAGQPVQLDAIASDPDGLGFPIFAFAGISTPIRFLWDFGGGTSSPLGVFADRPVVTFDLAPGEQSRTFNVAVTAFDTTGLSSRSGGSIRIDRSGPPLVDLVVDGVTLPFSPPILTRPSPQVRLGVVAFDENGLGFPIFAPFGSAVPVSVVWDFGGGQPASVLDVFSQNPTVTFPVGLDGQLSFVVSVTVLDTTGQSTTRSVILRFVN
jgi:hypothetical protein